MSLSSRSVAGIPLVFVLLLAAAVTAAGTWFLFLRSSGPPPVVSGSPAPAASTAANSPTTSPGGASPGIATPGEASPVGPGADGALSGAWQVDPSIGSFSDFSGSFVGYRIQEQLVNVGTNVAVGRTPDVTGSLTLDGTIVTTAEFSAQLAGLTSDNDGRDRRVRDAIGTSQFPAATFVLSAPIALAGLPGDGREITVTAPGRLTIRGSTRDVQFPLSATLSDGTLTIRAALEIGLADFGIPKPSSFLVLSIGDTATIEVQLQMTRR